MPIFDLSKFSMSPFGRSKARYKKYYVDNSLGNDGNDGSINSPFKTVSKINSLTFNGGDSIFFKRSQQWNEKLSPKEHDSNINNVYFGAYGDGDKPIISGSSLDHSLELFYPHFYFENIVFSGASGVGNETARVFTHDVVFENCDFSNSQQYLGFSAWSESGSIIYNVNLFECNAYNNAESGFFIGSDTGASGPRDCSIIGGSSHDNGTDINADHGVYVKFGVDVRYHKSYGNSSAGIKVNCETVTTSPYSPIVDGCLSYDNRWGYYVGHKNALLINNIGHSNTEHNLMTDSDFTDTQIINNTFVNATNSGCRFDATLTANTNSIFKNNIVVQDLSVAPDSVCIDCPAGDKLSLYFGRFDNNIYYADGNVSTPVVVWRNFSEWKSLPQGQDSNSLLTNPIFATNYSDLHIQDISPAIGSGSSLGVVYDYAGVVRPTPPSIGAYEYVE